VVAVAGDQVVRPHGLLLADGSVLKRGRDAGVVLVEPGQLGGEVQVGAALVGLGAEQDLEPVLVDGAEGRRAGGRAVVLHRLIGHTQQAGHAVPGQEQRTQPDHTASGDQDWMLIAAGTVLFLAARGFAHTLEVYSWSARGAAPAPGSLG
jgi:hypothetical protein